MREIMHLLLFLLFGLVVGVIARTVVPGREPGGWIVSILIGLGGAVVGGFLGRFFGFYGPGQPAGFLISILGAVVLLAGYHVLLGRRGAA
jgi:uncharacterized membrane protein YeaQ/YmgE (transglycosylase-associated protein family)